MEKAKEIMTYGTREYTIQLGTYTTQYIYMLDDVNYVITMHFGEVVSCFDIRSGGEVKDGIAKMD